MTNRRGVWWPIAANQKKKRKNKNKIYKMRNKKFLFRK